jgi:serine/threonine protein kinase
MQARMGQAEKKHAPDRIGRYEVRRELGSGGMGVVYAAFDPDLQRDVAVKLLRPDRIQGRVDAASARLRREAQITARLAHPNVVTIYEVGDSNGSVYIAMELVGGSSLAQWMTDVARPWREVLTMFLQAGRGLGAAHDAGLIHRDFKPGNVLVGDDHRARVTDFGLAHTGAVRGATLSMDTADVLSTQPSDLAARPKNVGESYQSGTWNAEDTIQSGLVADVVSTNAPLPLDESMVDMTLGGENTTLPEGVTSTGLFVGTPAYMAPELFTGGVADARTDQFAFCIALYEGVYGERPFSGDTAREIAQRVLAGAINPAPARTRVPKWLRNIIERGLAVDPAQRHPSIKSLLASIWFTARIMWD